MHIHSNLYNKVVKKRDLLTYETFSGDINGEPFVPDPNKLFTEVVHNTLILHAYSSYYNEGIIPADSISITMFRTVSGQICDQEP